MGQRPTLLLPGVDARGRHRLVVVSRRNEEGGWASTCEQTFADFVPSSCLVPVPAYCFCMGLEDSYFSLREATQLVESFAVFAKSIRLEPRHEPSSGSEPLFRISCELRSSERTDTFARVADLEREFGIRAVLGPANVVTVFHHPDLLK